MTLRIKEAILYFNIRRKFSENKLTQKELAKFVFPESNINQSKYYLSRWCNGFEYGKLKPEHIIKICEKTGVKPNFLFGYKE